jgi:GTPase SAR1 family protein
VELVVIGPATVGKSALVRRLTNGAFDTSYDSTIGVVFGTTLMDIDGRIVTVMLRDCAGNSTASQKMLFAKACDGVVSVVNAAVSQRLCCVLSRWWLCDPCSVGLGGTYPCCVGRRGS